MPTPNYGFLAQLILNAECGAAFEADTLNGKIKELEPYSTWPNTFRAAQFLPAVDYVNANARVRSAASRGGICSPEYDVVLTPRENTSVTNITGTPSIVVPTGFAIPQNSVAVAGGRGGRGAEPLDGAARPDSGRRAAPPPPARRVDNSACRQRCTSWVRSFRTRRFSPSRTPFSRATDFHLKRPPPFA